VARYYPAAIGAFPSLFLLLEEPPDAVVLDEPQVLDHTHTVEACVAFIDTVELLAGVITAFVAVLHLAVQEEAAALFKKSALLVSRTATDAVGHSDSLALHIMFEGKVSAADTAVHPAGSDQFFVHCLLQ